MKLKDTFVTQEMDGEQVMVEADGGFAGMVRSNATAAFIIRPAQNRNHQGSHSGCHGEKIRCPPRCDG